MERDPIFIKEGKFYTTAGVTAGIDLSLALVEEDLGHAMAAAIARTLVLFLRRPGGQSQYSTLLAQQEGIENARMRDLPVWVKAHLNRNSVTLQFIESFRYCFGDALRSSRCCIAASTRNDCTQRAGVLLNWRMNVRGLIAAAFARSSTSSSSSLHQARN